MTDREQAIANNLAQAHVTAVSADGQAIAKWTGQVYDQRTALEALNDAAGFAGNTIYDALDRVAIKGEDVTDVLKDVGRALMEAVLQAELLGQGPLAGILGTTSSTSGGLGGALGGILSLFTGGHAAGGFIPKGMFGTTGDNEWLVAGNDGVQVIPPRRGGSISSGAPVQVVINNNSSAKVSSRQRQDGGVTISIDDVVEEAVMKNIARGGGIARTFEGTYGVNRAGSLG
jgi:hypothetical protein